MKEDNAVVKGRTFSDLLDEINKHNSERAEIYVAGFFDGEGCVCIQDGQLRVDITNTDKFVLEKIKKDFKDCNLAIEMNTANGAYELYCTDHNAKKFLQRILPYLVVKKKQAELAIEFQQKKINFSGRKIPYFERKKRTEYAQKIKALKQNCASSLYTEHTGFCYKTLEVL